MCRLKLISFWSRPGTHDAIDTAFFNAREVYESEKLETDLEIADLLRLCQTHSVAHAMAYMCALWPNGFRCADPVIVVDVLSYKMQSYPAYSDKNASSIDWMAFSHSNIAGMPQNPTACRSQEALDQRNAEHEQQLFQLGAFCDCKAWR